MTKLLNVQDMHQCLMFCFIVDLNDQLEYILSLKQVSNGGAAFFSHICVVLVSNEAVQHFSVIE